MLSEKRKPGVFCTAFTRPLYLRHHPGAGQFEPELEDLGEGHRRWVAGNYKIVYLIHGYVIRVTDIFDARQDPRKMRG